MERDRAYLREWLSWVDATTHSDHVVEFIRSALQQFAQSQGFHGGMWLDGEFVGGIGCAGRIDWPNKKVEFGYWLVRHLQGRGIVSDALRAMMRMAFTDWDLNRVELRVAVGNTRSNAIATRLGFTLEGVQREALLVGGVQHDVNFYGLLRREWSVMGQRGSNSA